MTDLEMVKKCAEAMGLPHEVSRPIEVATGRPHGNAAVIVCPKGAGLMNSYGYDPLHNDAQAMELVRSLELSIDAPNKGRDWVVFQRMHEDDAVTSCDLNRAIVECVAKLCWRE